MLRDPGSWGMGLSPEVRVRLLASMHAGRLVVVCGAGLSMAAPSNLPSAASVAEACFDAYRVTVDPDCDIAMRHDLEAFAQHFADQNTLKSVFIEKLVPWATFVRPSNPGHAAVADFLVTRTAVASLSSNYDFLIEKYALENGFDFLSSLDGEQATVRAHIHSPLLKFHGCATMDRPSTVWTKSQLDDPVIAERIAKTKVWMAANLRQKDLLVVGFWTDWDYLNAVLDDVIDGLAPLSVTVVDPCDEADLESKAPALWALAHGPNVTFTHVKESGSKVLDELRRAFSRNYLSQVLHAGRQAFEAATGVECQPEWLVGPDFGSEDLYGLRRDAEGVPSGEPAVRSTPGPSDILGAFHLLLRHAGAVATPQGYELNGRTIRVVNGANKVLSQLKSRFVEAPAVIATDIVVAPGSTDLPMPANVIRPGVAGNFMRPAPLAAWLSFDNARQELGV